MKLGAYFIALLRHGPKGLIRELGITLKDRFVTDDDRMRAIEILSFLPARIAVPQLLKRFDLVAENALRDRKEKDLVARMIAGEGKSVLPMVVTYSRDGRNISWPLAIIGQLTDPFEHVTILLEILSTQYPLFDEDVIKRNREVLVSLQGLRDERIAAHLEPHLNSRYPEIREAALTCAETLPSKTPGGLPA